VRWAQNVVKTTGTILVRFYLMTSTATPSADTILYRDVSNASGVTLIVSELTTGKLRLTNNLTATTTDTSTMLVAGTWYRVEVRHLLSDTVGEMELRLYNDNGTLLDDISISGEDTLSTNLLNYDFGKATATTVVFSYDDIGINDELGGSHDSWPGPGKVYLLVPNSDVSITWENEAAGVATYTKIDDLPGAPDETTTYNTEVVSLNSIDRFGMTNLGAEVPSNATITLVAVHGRIGSNQTSATAMRFKLWDEAGALTNGPSCAAGVNGWRIPKEFDYLYFNATGKTKANLDSFDIGYENITDIATRERRVTALWANVEWVAAAAASVTQQGFGWFFGGQ
jgi:hypothetical protein